MAIQVQGTTVIDDTRNLVNINNIDATSSKMTYVNLGTFSAEGTTVIVNLALGDFFTLTVNATISLTPSFGGGQSTYFKTALVKMKYNGGTINLNSGSIWANNTIPNFQVGKTYIITIIYDGQDNINRLNAVEFSQ